MTWHNFLFDLTHLPDAFWIGGAAVLFVLYLLADIARNGYR